MADIDPLEYRQRSHPDLDVATHGLTLWDLDREFATGGFGGAPMLKLRNILGILRDSYCRTVGIEYMHIQDPEQRQWIQAARGALRQAVTGRAAAHPAQPQRRRGVRDVPADQVRRPEAVQPRGRRVGHPAARPDPVPRRGRGPRRGLHRHAAPWPPQRAGQHRRQVLLPDLPRVRGQAGPEDGPGLRRREVPPRHRGQVRLRGRRQDQGLPGGEPVPPRGGQPGARGHRAGQAGPPRPRRRGVPRAAPAHARRRGLRRPGRRGRDAEPLASCAATAPAARSTWSSTTRSASRPRRRRRAPRSTAPTSPG